MSDTVELLLHSRLREIKYSNNIIHQNPFMDKTYLMHIHSSVVQCNLSMTREVTTMTVYSHYF